MRVYVFDEVVCVHVVGCRSRREGFGVFGFGVMVRPRETHSFLRFSKFLHANGSLFCRHGKERPKALKMIALPAEGAAKLSSLLKSILIKPHTLILALINTMDTRTNTHTMYERCKVISMTY